MNPWKRLIPVAGLGLTALFCVIPPVLAQTAPALGVADTLSVLGASAITNTGSSVVTGDLGIWPNNGSSITGFPPGIVVGAVLPGNAVAMQAQSDLSSAYNDLAGRACDTVLTGIDLGGEVLGPGVYCFTSTAQLTGNLILDAQGNADALFIFQIGSSLTSASNASVELINGGLNCNVYWQVGSSATLGTTTNFAGSILALTSITLNTGAAVSGRLLARNGAVTLDTNDAAICTVAPPMLSVVKSANPNPVVIGSSAVYTVVVSNTATQARTLGNLFLYDNLASDITLTSTTGSDPGWSCNGTGELVCTYTNTLLAAASTTLLLNVDIGLGALTGDNTARVSGGGDPLCPAPPVPAAARCSGSVLASTVPVTLSDIDASAEAGVLSVRFGTLTEMGTLGYRVLTGNADQPLTTLNDDLIGATGEQMEPQRYLIQGPYHGERQIWIEEHTIKGHSIAYGPFPVGIKVGRPADSVEIDWSAISAEQSVFRSQQRASVQRSGSVLEAEVKIDSDGWYVLSFEDLLAQGLDWSGASVADLHLRKGASAIPMLASDDGAFGPGTKLAFLGHSVKQSLYTGSATYRLSAGEPGARLVAISAAPTTGAVTDSVRASYRQEPNRSYLATAAGADPWYALKIQRNGANTASATENFTLSTRAANSSNERISVEIWGGIDYPQSPDHSVRLLVNGTQIASASFDGIRVHLIDADLPDGLLTSGSNAVTLQLVADTGLNVDLIQLNAITVDYRRELRASDNQLDFSLPADTVSSTAGETIFTDSFETGSGTSAATCAVIANCDHYQVTGLSRADVVVLRERAGIIERLSDVQTSPASGGYRLNFASNRHPNDRYWIAPASGRAPSSISAQTPVGDPLAGAPAELLIISHPSFIAGLDPLVNARLAEGFSVRVVDMQSLYRRYSDGVIDPNAVQRAVADAYDRLGTRYVLLVGGDTYDYRNYGGGNSISFVPTHYRQTDAIVRYSAADSVSADVNGDGLMDVALGRLPVRSSLELERAIAKTLSYPQANHGGRLLLQADRADPLQFDQQLAAIAERFGLNWTATSLSLDDYPSGSIGTAAARLALSSAMNSGQAFTAYLGHSAPDRWTFSGLLSAQDVYNGFFGNTGKPTVLWSLGCYGSYFVQPNYSTIAHAMMLQDNGGAAAVLGVSGLAAVASDVAWINTLLRYLPQERLGDAMMLSQRLLRSSGAQFDDVGIGANLLGDPTLRLNQ